MWVSRAASLAVFSMQLCFLARAGGSLSGKDLVDDTDTTGARGRRAVSPSLKEGREAENRRQPFPRLQQVGGATGTGGLTQSKAMSKSLLSTSKAKATGKIHKSPLPTAKTKSRGLQIHLQGHGMFNMDTYSCPGIQLKTCRKPSDCDGCFGLYTCKLPREKCDLKAVSQPTGSFFQSIQNR